MFHRGLRHGVSNSHQSHMMSGRSEATSHWRNATPRFGSGQEDNGHRHFCH